MTSKLDFHSLDDFDRSAIEALLDEAVSLRDHPRPSLLAGRSVILLFLAPSLRTRVSMELAAQQLGAHCVNLQAGGGLWPFAFEQGVVMREGAAEHIKEAAGVLARYGDLLAVRAFPRRESWEEDARDAILRGFMRWAPVPVLNLESSLYHPCQALADLLTLREKAGAPRGKVVLSWADHPRALPVAVPNSFALAATQMGWDLTIARPEGYDLPEEILTRCRAYAEQAGARFETTADRGAAFTGARVVYAKSWGRLDRYGEDERELAERKQRGLAEWCVDGEIMGRTDDAWFMHCLPVRRNVVVSDAVIDSARSLVLDQAENRLHVQRAILARLLAQGEDDRHA